MSTKTPSLPPGWILYAVIDAEIAKARKAAPDPGARREDGRAYVFGVQASRRFPAHFRASVRGTGSASRRTRSFDMDELAEAARWCDAVVAEQDAAEVRS